jgi:hypothetical protein
VSRSLVAAVTVIGGEVHAAIAPGFGTPGEALALFDMDPVPAGPVPERESADRRRTRRQLEALGHGQHPLGLCFGVRLRLHPEAPPADDRGAPGPRCGACVSRQPWGAHGFAKCLRGEGGWATHSAASDVRAWWPACEHWEAVPE